MVYTDAEMLMATQVAYLDFKRKIHDDNETVGDTVEAVLEEFGIRDKNTREYIVKEEVTGAGKAQFETAQNIINLSRQNHTDSWRRWRITDSCNKEDTSGYYGCLIDTGDGNAIIGCRGSESYSVGQIMRDWILADVGRLNNPLTWQQEDATVCVAYLYETYKDKYKSYSFTGHSLGGSLAMHAAITAPENMHDKINKVISFDGPGFSDEYLKKHRKKIEKIKNKLNHYEYSWVGSLLIQPQGIHNRVIKAHDDRLKNSIFVSQIYRHHTRNIEFDEKGNVMDGKRGVLQIVMGALSRFLEKMPFGS